MTDLGGAREIYGQTRASVAEQNEYEAALFAKRTTEIPSNMAMRVSYDASNRVQYVGFSTRGLAEGTDGWLLQKFAYDGTSTRVVSRLIAYGDWTNRATESYA